MGCRSDSAPNNSRFVRSSPRPAVTTDGVSGVALRRHRAPHSMASSKRGYQDEAAEFEDGVLDQACQVRFLGVSA